MGNIQLCNCPDMDINHNHAPYFTLREKQNLWFNSKTILVIDDTQYVRKHNNIKVGFSIDYLKYCNYLIVNNSENEKYYYFIQDKLYLNEFNTELVLKLDVLQTYMIDLQFKECLIEREHINRWFGQFPNWQNLCDEELEVGEMEIAKITTVYDYNNKGCYIITSSDRLGVSDEGRNNPNPNEGGGGTTDGNINYKKGYCSQNMLVVLKGDEGFSPTPYNIGDGTNTIGYGVTEVHQPDSYNQLAPTCTEIQASEVLGTLLYNNFSSKVLQLLLTNGFSLNDIKQCEFDAFVSFAYNSGLGGLQSSDIFKMYVQLKPKNEIAEVWKTCNIMPGTDFEQGLRRRRERESKMFLGTYEPKPISNLQGGYVTDNNGKGYIPINYQ